jgi:hypothetical protein
MSDDLERPFVARHGRVDDRRPPTPDEIAEMRAILAKTPRPRTQPMKQLTDTERLAIARKKLDERTQP